MTSLMELSLECRNACVALLVVEERGEERHLAGHRQDLVDLLLILNRRRDLGVGQHEGHLLRDAVGIDRDRDGAEPLGGRHGPVQRKAKFWPMTAILPPRRRPSAFRPDA